MVEIIGDNVEPVSLRLPLLENVAVSGAGLIMLSGSKIWFHTGGAFELVTSA